MVLQGAEILLYPTAIGSEPQDAGLDSCDHWKRVMQGHAGANLVKLTDNLFPQTLVYLILYLVYVSCCSGAFYKELIDIAYITFMFNLPSSLH